MASCLQTHRWTCEGGGGRGKRESVERGVEKAVRWRRGAGAIESEAGGLIKRLMGNKTRLKRDSKHVAPTNAAITQPQSPIIHKYLTRCCFF